ncbi:unnamed protein product [Linum tenue]|uniref:Uncharacterized protein n=1 Tax=Linum tenue TaxID=586396 RepID=A0AAV0GYR0_9ROSI|nr:unnamed protein product [Linum tenue]
MNSATADSRPKCLVIDKIDGALGDGRGAVDVILKMIEFCSLYKEVYQAPLTVLWLKSKDQILTGQNLIKGLCPGLSLNQIRSNVTPFSFSLVINFVKLQASNNVDRETRTVEGLEEQNSIIYTAALSTKSFSEDSISSMLHILSPSTIRSVPMRLLSEKEKNDMDQLVSKMVSYSVTYKNARPNLHSTKPVQEAAADSSTLSFDPPITEFINFKGCAYAHNTLPLALKQVLVHEVEKRRILLVSKSTHDTEVCNEANLDLRERGNHKEPSSSVKHIGAFAANREKGKKGVSIPSSLAISSSVEASESSVSNAKLNSCEDTKKSSSSAANFFDRFRKVGSRGFLKAETVDCKVTTLERDSRPVLFKYNEGFTNAVKRPVKMREFLS